MPLGGERLLLRAGLAILVALATGCARETASPEGAEAAAAPAQQAEPVNIDLWLERLEVGSRELYNAREEIARAVGLRQGDRVADIGAGTGIYTLQFADIVGDAGVVFAVDIAPRFLSLINQRADDLGLVNIVSVLSRPDSITLPSESVDVVFIADTYHYFDNPDLIMGTVFQSLRPGGRLVIVDYELAEGASPPADHRHVRFGKSGLRDEVVIYGFEYVREIALDGIAENYILEFRRP